MRAQGNNGAFDTKQGLEFTRRLRGDPRFISPPEWSVDWDDAPLPYKLYIDGRRRIPLSGSFPARLELPPREDLAVTVSRESAYWLGSFLYHAYGLVSCRLSGARRGTEGGLERTDDLLPVLRRPVASGGALYPSELYVYLRSDNDAPQGVYHYDVAHHALVPIRYGNYDQYLHLATGCEQWEVESSRAVALISLFFWKNYFKYADLAYRLGAQDVGALCGHMLTLADSLHLATAVRFQFLDTALNHLLGLNPLEESVYATIFLKMPEGNDPTAANKSLAANSHNALPAADLVKLLPPVKHNFLQRSRSVKRSDVIEGMHRSSLISEPEQLAWYVSIRRPPRPYEHGARVDLPPASEGLYSDLEETIRRRSSSGELFKPGGVSMSQLSDILWQMTCEMNSDLTRRIGERRNNRKPIVNPTVYGVLSGIEGLNPGCYRYDEEAHQLVCVRPGDYRRLLQRNLLLGNLNLRAVPACLHLVGEQEYQVEVLGNRGYRIQQMWAGVMVSRLQLAATAVGLNAHPILGFNVPGTDQMYGIEHLSVTTLLQIAVSNARAGLYFEGPVNAGT